MNGKSGEKNRGDRWICISLACSVFLILMFVLDRIERSKSDKELQAFQERVTILQLTAEQAKENIDIQKQLAILTEKMDELKHDLEEIKEGQ